MEQQDITRAVKEFMLKELLPDESSDSFDDSTPLISSGILNSLATLQLVTFLEDSFDISVKAREVGIDKMDTLTDIASFVLEKRGGA